MDAKTSPDVHTSAAVCPVCGMVVELTVQQGDSSAYGTAFGLAWRGKTHWLCCEACRKKLEADPRRYVDD